MDDRQKLTEGRAEELERMLSPRVDIPALAEEKDPEKLNELAFELYKEALSVVNLAAHLLDDVAAAKTGWGRNQAVGDRYARRRRCPLSRGSGRLSRPYRPVARNPLSGRDVPDDPRNDGRTDTRGYSSYARRTEIRQRT